MLNIIAYLSHRGIIYHITMLETLIFFHVLNIVKLSIKKTKIVSTLMYNMNCVS